MKKDRGRRKGLTTVREKMKWEHFKEKMRQRIWNKVHRCAKGTGSHFLLIISIVVR